MFHATHGTVEFRLVLPPTRKETSEYENGRAVEKGRPQHLPVNETPKARQTRVGLAALLSQCSLTMGVVYQGAGQCRWGAFSPE